MKRDIIHDNVKNFLTNSLNRKYLVERINIINFFTITDYKRVYGNDINNSSLKIGDIVNYKFNVFEDIYIRIDFSDYFKEDELEHVKNSNIIFLDDTDKPQQVHVDEKVVINFNDYKTPDRTFKVISPWSRTNEDGSITRGVKLVKVDTIDNFNGYQIYQDDVNVYGKNEYGSYIVLTKVDTPIVKASDTLYITNEDIENYTGKDILETTVGRYFYNYICLVVPLSNKFPYINTLIKSTKSQIEKTIVNMALNKEITISEVRSYIDHSFYLASFGEICTPNFSRKSITTHPDLENYKKELLEKYKDTLHETTTQVLIENLLIQKDKEWLEGDISEGFYGDTSKKTEVHRKKQYIASGAIESVQKGTYDFIPTSLTDGWNLDSFISIANEIRRGSYSRGVETQVGGSITKTLLRMFQHIKITSDDCGSIKYMKVHITKSNYNDYIGNFMNNNGKLVELTKGNIESFINKDIEIRNVLYCKEPLGYCFKCTGNLFKDMNLTNIGTLVLEVGKVFTTASLKKMHGTKLETFDISENLNDFLL